MKLLEAKELIDKMVELWPDQEVRLSMPIDAKWTERLGEIRSMGFFAHLEASAYADIELVVKDRYEHEDARPTRDEAPSSES